MTKKNQKIVTIFSLVFLGLCLSVYMWDGIYVPPTPNDQETKIFPVALGEGTKEISVNLKNQRLIKSGLLFRFYTLTIGVAGKLQAGDYQLSSSMNMAEITKKLSAGDIIRQKITLIEGWDLRDISFYLQEQGIVKAKDFSIAANLARNYVQDFDFLNDKPETLSLEGYLFPDTYEIQKGETAEEIVSQILKNFDQKLTPGLREETKRQNKTIFKIITMASLIEKEVKTLPDKKLVAGILWKRLENKMPLQVDATISYITGKKNGKVLIADTQIDSPFNTYKYLGLPLGPISNPGLDSITAAIYPENSKFWYYLSTPEGETIFSQTLEEHNIARAKYLK